MFEAAGGETPSAEDDGGRSVAGQGDAPGRSFKKAMKARGLVGYLQGVFGVFIRKPCNVLLFQKSLYFCKPRRPALKPRVRAMAVYMCSVERNWE